MKTILFSLFAIVLAGCVPLPPTPQDIQGKKFEVPPGKAVIYVVRTPSDSFEVSGLALDDSAIITTHPYTYYRWEVDPGVHRIAGYGPANEEVTLNAAPGGIYFLEHTVRGTMRSGPQVTSLRQIGEPRGRALVMHSRLL